MWKENPTPALVSSSSGWGNGLPAQAGIGWVTSLLLKLSIQEEVTEGSLKQEWLELG